MRFRNLLLIFAVGILLGAAAVSLFGDAGPSPDAPKNIEPPEPSPAPIVRERYSAQSAPPPATAPKPDPPKPAKPKQTHAPYPAGTVKPFMEEAQVIRRFDAAHLESTGCFSSDDVAWIQLRWEEFQEERRALVGGATRGEREWDGAEWVELQRTLRETLGDLRYSGLLYATGQGNGVRVADVSSGSRAAEAGIQRWDLILSYNGERIYERRALEALALGEFFGSRVEIEVRHPDGTVEALSIEPGPLGARLTVASRLSPCEDLDR